MRELTQRVLGLLLIPAFFGVGMVAAQVTSRHPFSASAAKTSSITTEIPCAGTVILSEDFEAGIPAGWTVVDGDTLTPEPQTGLQKGWQSRTDYRDTSNHVVVSPSWYINAGSSNDWLISPPVTLGSNPCLSWKCYSQDPYFKEAYEVRVALTPDTAALMFNPTVKVDLQVSNDVHDASASLLAWAGQTVHFAFRQISYDEFVLALDDVKVTNVNSLDVGVHALTYGTVDPGDTVRVRFEVANYGSDTVRSFQALYAINGGTPQTMSVSPVSIPPNALLTFLHDSLYISDSLDAFYAVCAWTNLPNAAADQEIHNDSLCNTLTVGNPVGIHESTLGAEYLRMFPNPCADQIQLHPSGLRGMNRMKVEVIDIGGRLCKTEAFRVGDDGATLDVHDLRPGMYFVRVTVGNRNPIVQKLIKR